MLVRQHLHLDVARIDDRLFDVNLTITKCPLGFALCCLQSGLEFFPRTHQAHAFPAPARGRLQHHRIANLRGHLFGLPGRLQPSRSPWHERYSGFFHFLPRPRFRSHHFHRSRGRAYELHSGIRARLGKLRVLGEKPVPRMDCIRAASFRNV